nr:Tat pathway signal protein [Bacteroidota bacterium]
MKKLTPLFLTAFILITTSCNQQVNNGQDKQQKSAEESTFDLDDLHRRTFNFFWDLADPVSGLTPDRWPTESFSSIAAMGYGLTAYIIGVEHQYVTREEAANRVLKTLRFLWDLPQGDNETDVAGYQGFYYHFLDMRTGMRFKTVELSTIDTGLLMAGILSCLTYFDGDSETESKIRKLADSLYRRVEWDWFLNDNDLLSMGWHPEKGFLKAEWSGYNEAMILYILALGSPTHPVPGVCWKNWTQNYLWADFMGYEHVNFGPLFGHQFSHMYIDFRKIQDEYMKEKGIDYFENSRRATLSNRAYCVENKKGFVGYDENIWGLTACDGPANMTRKVGNEPVKFHTYWARGVASNYLNDDGTITPTAAGGSIPFAPEVCIPALQAMYDRYGEHLYDKYGFKDAFNPTFIDNGKNKNGWFDTDYLGLDQGPILIMLENHRTGLVWEIMKKNPYIISGLKKAGFEGGWLDETTP